MILVTGATGKVGGETARLLASNGLAVRVFVRSRDRAAHLKEVGAEIVVGDLDDPRSIEAALLGISTLVLVSPGDPTQEIAVVNAAVHAGVQHVVYLTSKASHDAPIARRRWHAQVEDALASSGLAFTLLRSNAYMQNVLALGPRIAATSSFASCAGNGRMGMVDTRDVAAVASVIAADPGTHAGATYRLTGPSTVSYHEIAATLSELLGRTVTYEPISEEQDRVDMIAAGVPAPVAAMNAQASALNASGDAEWVSPDVEAIAARPPRAFRTFAADFLEAFRP